MSRKGWFALYFTLLLTVALVLLFLFMGGPAAVTSIVAVLGLLLAIVEFFMLHILSAQQGQPPHKHSSIGGVQLYSEDTTSSQRKLFRRSRFRRSDDEDEQ